MSDYPVTAPCEHCGKAWPEVRVTCGVVPLPRVGGPATEGRPRKELICSPCYCTRHHARYLTNARATSPRRQTVWEKIALALDDCIRLE